MMEVKLESKRTFSRKDGEMAVRSVTRKLQRKEALAEISLVLAPRLYTVSFLDEAIRSIQALLDKDIKIIFSGSVTEDVRAILSEISSVRGARLYLRNGQKVERVPKSAKKRRTATRLDFGEFDKLTKQLM